MPDVSRTCPHCGSRLCRWRVPDGMGYNEEYMLVCFNDSCGYYRGGWAWMQEQYAQRVSYRYMCSPVTGASSPLPVWSDSAMREQIMDEGEGDDE